MSKINQEIALEILTFLKTNNNFIDFYKNSKHNTRIVNEIFQEMERDKLIETENRREMVILEDGTIMGLFKITGKGENFLKEKQGEINSDQIRSKIWK
jgi:DNA-binding transcriptional regulator YhcF (GntR family)